VKEKWQWEMPVAVEQKGAYTKKKKLGTRWGNESHKPNCWRWCATSKVKTTKRITGLNRNLGGHSRRNEGKGTEKGPRVAAGGNKKKSRSGSGTGGAIKINLGLKDNSRPYSESRTLDKFGDIGDKLKIRQTIYPD